MYPPIHPHTSLHRDKNGDARTNTRCIQPMPCLSRVPALAIDSREPSLVKHIPSHLAEQTFFSVLTIQPCLAGTKILDARAVNPLPESNQTTGQPTKGNAIDGQLHHGSIASCNPQLIRVMQSHHGTFWLPACPALRRQLKPIYVLIAAIVAIQENLGRSRAR